MSPSVATFLFEAANFLSLPGPRLGLLPARTSAIETPRAARGRAVRSRGGAQRKRYDCSPTPRRNAEAESALVPLRAALRKDAEAEAERLLETARRRADEEQASLRAELVRIRAGSRGALARDAAAATRALVERCSRRSAARISTWPWCAQPSGRSSRPPHGTVVVEAARPLAGGRPPVLADALGPARVRQPVRVVPALVGGVRITTGPASSTRPSPGWHATPSASSRPDRARGARR